MSQRARHEMTHHPAHSARSQAESGWLDTLRMRLRRVPRVLALAVVLIVVLAAAFLLHTMSSEREHLVERGRVLSAQLERARSQAADIERQLDELDSDAFVEKYARGQLGMIRPNEILFVDGEEAAEASEVQPSGE
ncbi:MAG: septum formation initiator family protein [Bacillota bacterium]|nr:septum formation initiator family protein [Bacillota bacterium]